VYVNLFAVRKKESFVKVLNDWLMISSSLQSKLLYNLKNNSFLGFRNCCYIYVIIVLFISSTFKLLDRFTNMFACDNDWYSFSK